MHLRVNGPTYRLRQGETLYSVARKFQTTQEILASLNSHIHPRMIRPGMIINMPTPTQAIMTQATAQWAGTQVAMEPIQTQTEQTASEPERAEAAQAAAEPEQTAAAQTAMEQVHTEPTQTTAEQEQTEAMQVAMEPIYTQPPQTETEQAAATPQAMEPIHTLAMQATLPLQAEAMQMTMEPLQTVPAQASAEQQTTAPARTQPGTRAAAHTLNQRMRMLWEQHVWYTRELIISILSDLPDQEEVTARLLRNPAQVAALFGPAFGAGAEEAITRLYTRHLEIGGELIKAIKANDRAQTDRLNQEWYRNADQIAEELSGLSPRFSQSAVRGMMRRHLDLTGQEVVAQSAGDYSDSIELFDESEQEALMMADYFTAGIEASS